MRVVVVGDVLLDRDLDGPSTRLCPDAPVPVVDVEEVAVRAGGAGLVARLLAADGHAVVLVTALGDDPQARVLRSCLGGIDLVAGPSNGPTPVKTRVLRSGEPVVRFDEGCGPPPAPGVTAAMVSAIAAAEAVVVADYGRGLLADPTLREALGTVASRVPVVWDPHPRGSAPVAGTVVTPNLAEALTATGGSADAGPDGAGGAAARLCSRWRAAAVVVTLGADGAWVHAGGGRGEARHVAATVRVDDVDTCGAGDRFAGALAVAVAGPGDLPAAVSSANEATAAFLRAGGVRALPAPERTGPSRVPARGAVEQIERVRADGGTVVATGGCFDLVHAGHVRTLRAARAHGDALVVCLNSDASVRRLKGLERPLMTQEDRSELLLALDCVDAVVVFDEDSPLEVLGRLRPDVWVKGGDYIAELLPEYEVVSRWGGRCVTVPFHPGRSTTSLAAALARIA